MTSTVPIGDRSEAPQWRGFAAHLALADAAGGVLEGDCLPGRGGRVFGGHVGAHAVLAAGRVSASGKLARSLHLQFLRAGVSEERVRYTVTCLRRGRTLEHWRVDASQAAGLIATAVVVLDDAEPDDGHAVVAGRAGLPEDSRDISGEAREGTEPALRQGLEIREGEVTRGGGDVAPTRDVWLRCVEPLAEDRLLAAAVFVWCSDLELAWTADLPYRESIVTRQAASMDHVVHLHGGLSLEEWWLYRLSSPVLRDRRALVTGQAFPGGGALAAMVTQQVLLRMTF